MEAPAANPRLRYIPSFDGVRGVAVLAVYAHHSFYGFFTGGFLGVTVFFVLSGYLITSLLLREYRQTGTIRFSVFYQHRVCRLLPALVLALVLATLFWPLRARLEWTAGYVYSMAAVLFSFSNFNYRELGPLSVTWSLAVEEQFYLLWPLSFLLLLRKDSPRVLYGTILTLLLFCCGLRAVFRYVTPLSVDPYPLIFTSADALLIGALAALVAGRAETVAWASRLGRWRGPDLLFLVFLIACYAGNKFFSLFYYGFTLAALLSAIFLTCLASAEGPLPVRRLLEWPPLVWLGRRSYGIYLYHLVIVFSLESLRVPHSRTNLAWVSLLRIVAVLLFAEAAYRLVERPFLRMKWREEAIPAKAI